MRFIPKIVPVEKATGVAAEDDGALQANAELISATPPVSRIHWLIDAILLPACYFIAGYFGLSLALCSA